VKSWDAIVVGAGIIGLSLAMELNKQGLRVLVVEKGEPGREASWAAAIMLVEFPVETPPGLRELASASALMYLEFVRELEGESGLKIDLRSVGTLLFLDSHLAFLRDHSLQVSYPFALPASALASSLQELEPALRAPDGTPSHFIALFLRERCVDPRHLTGL
jgi:glycine/D-amino acid oxidase-like deaminating enzyme